MIISSKFFDFLSNHFSEIVSGLALFVAVIAVVAPLVWDIKKTKDERLRQVYKDIYGDLLYEQFPQQCIKIDYVNNSYEAIDEVLDTIRILRKKTKYFNYYDKPFYDAFNKRLSDFEDYLIKVYDNRPDQNRIASEMEKRDKHIKELYDVIRDRI